MGLDMYLDREVYIGAQWEHRNVTGTIEIMIGDRKADVNLSKVSSITERVAYWRKANAIHKWFVDNIQGGVDNCGRYYVGREDLQRLLDTVNLVLENSKVSQGQVSHGQTIKDGKWVDILEDGEVIVNPEVAEEYLPTRAGFFFGGTGYDQWYLDDLKYTRDVLEEVLSKEEKAGLVDYFYSSSW
jgi:hypothetical protein